ncbi:MAG: CRISPR system precrRNA processing endoribonuclease RAMP protein Cas6 [Pseudomonadota bacterium]|nr:CRISPR system precrRNA processing endoribonuclease RAMP protein Cas6 [Pseudomonadota bacterium]
MVDPAQISIDDNSRFVSEVAGLAHATRLLAYRVSLTTPDVRATVSMLRGVWGAALRQVDPDAYVEVFEGGAARRIPRYIIRPAPPDTSDAPAFEWLVLGEATRYMPQLLDAWQLALDRGLGRDRIPASIRSFRRLCPDGSLAAPGDPVETDVWRLSSAVWPVAGDPATTPVRVDFASPLRILREGRLLIHPDLADIVEAGARRLFAFADGTDAQSRREVSGPLRRMAREMHCSPWRGDTARFVRWSASQGTEIELHGTKGSIELHEGAGSVWPVVLAASWLHLGKGTVFGLGQLTLSGLPDRQTGSFREYTVSNVQS